MPIIISPESELGKELARWEQHRTKYVGDEQQPGNPYVFRPYPKMLYKAQRAPNGQTLCMMPAPSLYDFTSIDQYNQACLLKESFDRSCQKIVADETQDRIAAGQGWSDTPALALELAEAQARAVGNAAAEAAYAAQRMSDKAQRELKAADQETHEHVVDVKGKKRGRKPKAVIGTGELDA